MPNYAYEIPPSLTSVLPLTTPPPPAASAPPPPPSTFWEVVSQPGAYQVRGKNYLEDKIKVPSRASAMEVVASAFSFLSFLFFQLCFPVRLDGVLAFRIIGAGISIMSTGAASILFWRGGQWPTRFWKRLDVIALVGVMRCDGDCCVVGG